MSLLGKCSLIFIAFLGSEVCVVTVVCLIGSISEYLPSVGTSGVLVRTRFRQRERNGDGLKWGLTERCHRNENKDGSAIMYDRVFREEVAERKNRPLQFGLLQDWGCEGQFEM